MNKSAPGCIQWPARTEICFREKLLQLYPALSDEHPHGDLFRRLVQYQIWGSFFGSVDESEEDVMTDSRSRLVLPYEYVAQFAGVSPTTHGFNALSLLQEFEAEVWPLDLDASWSYQSGRARTICTDLPDDVCDMLSRCRIDPPSEETCFFVSGKRYTRYHFRKEICLMQHRLSALVNETPKSHPAWELLRYINDDMSQRMVWRLVRQNWNRLTQAWQQMPEHHADPARQASLHYKKQRVRAILDNVRDFPELRYRGTWRSPRIYPLGLSLLALPRELRDIALFGTAKYDMRSCQFCIIASQWNVPQLRDFLLQPGSSIWRTLADHMGVDVNIYKPVLKTALFSIVFGMNIAKVRTKIAKDDDDGKVTSLSAVQIEAFLDHPIIADVIIARKKVLREIQKAGGMRDCFGVWHAVEWDKTPTPANPYKRRRDPCAVLATCVQAVEAQLLMSILPVLRKERSVSLVATIHDGLVVKYTDRTQELRIERRIKRTLVAAARLMSVNIELVRECDGAANAGCPPTTGTLIDSDTRPNQTNP